MPNPSLLTPTHELAQGRSTNEALTNIAAALALIVVPKGDTGKHKVTFIFNATRDDKGFFIGNISLEQKPVKP